MSKRLIRIEQKDLPEKSVALLQKDINVILESNHTLFGHCYKIDNQLLFIKDYRFKKHILAFTKIAEVIYDYEALY